MNAKTWLGWGLLATALAVPVFMFWNWRNATNAGGPPVQDKPHAGGVPGSGGGTFDRLSNPILSETSTPTLAQVQPEPAPAPAPSPEPAPAPAPPPEPAPAPAPPQPEVPPAAALLDGKDAYHPKTDRDPTLSPADIRSLDEAQQANLRSQEDRVEQKAARVKRVKKEIPIEARIQVMAIINVEHKVPAAIVNDKMVSKGDVVLGARIERITETSVVFKHGTKIFTKRVGR